MIKVKDYHKKCEETGLTVRGKKNALKLKSRKFWEESGVAMPIHGSLEAAFASLEDGPAHVNSGGG